MIPGVATISIPASQPLSHGYSPWHFIALGAIGVIHIVDARKASVFDARVALYRLEHSPATLAPRDIPRGTPEQVEGFHRLGAHDVASFERRIIPQGIILGW